MEKSFTNIAEAFWHQVTKNKNRLCLSEKINGKWHNLTWHQVGEKTARMISAFKKMGFQKGDRLVVLADNCPQWIITDFAAMTAGLVTVPIYASQTEEQIRYIVNHSEAKFAVVKGKQRLSKLMNLELITKIIFIDNEEVPKSEKIISFENFIAGGDPTYHFHELQTKLIAPENLATIMYTSGTTSQPKGVMLSHENHMAQSKSLDTRSQRTIDDIILSYLPLSHITERANIYRQAHVGYLICFGGGFDTLTQDLKELRPTSFVAVPRIWEKFQEGILQRVKQASPSRQKLFEELQILGREAMALRQNGYDLPVFSAIKFNLLQRLIGKKIKRNLGLDRCRYFVSGAAPISLDTMGFYYALGIRIVEAYGLTECSGGSHMNLRESPAFGTVGPHLDGVECKIAEDGEILLRGKSISIGYFKEPELTAETFKDGWLYTGDIGHCDFKGNLKITDRKKNIIVTSGGKNVAPTPIEAHIKKHPMVSQAVVIGDRRKYLTALITLSGGTQTNEAQVQIQNHIDEINSHLPSYETIKKFSILDKDFSVEGGELTPTLKARRNYIQEKYTELIDTMY